MWINKYTVYMYTVYHPKHDKEPLTFYQQYDMDQGRQDRELPSFHPCRVVRREFFDDK